MTREEALKILREMHDNALFSARTALETLIPELAESEDERVIRTLFSLIKDNDWVNGGTKDECLSWLEKHKESDKAIAASGKQKKPKIYWNPTEEDVALFNKAITTNTSLGPQDRAKLDIIRMKFKHHSYIEQKPVEQNSASGNSENPNNHAEWSEEDEDTYKRVYNLFNGAMEEWYKVIFAGCFPTITKEKVLAMLKSLRSQPKQESEPMKIKYAGKIYKVYGTKEFPGGIVGYKITDEPGDFDYIINPDEVLGGYDIKSNGSFYPTKEANFSQSHWKPSKEQLEAARYVSQFDYGGHKAALISLYEQLKQI